MHLVGFTLETVSGVSPIRVQEGTTTHAIPYAAPSAFGRQINVPEVTLTFRQINLLGVSVTSRRIVIWSRHKNSCVSFIKRCWGYYGYCVQMFVSRSEILVFCFVFSFCPSAFATECLSRT